MMILGGFPVYQKILFFGCHFSKLIFAEGRSTRSPWSLEKIQGPIWRSKDHLAMKGLSKNVENHGCSRNPLFGETENWRRGVYFDAEYVSAPFCHIKTAWIALWSKIVCFGWQTSLFFIFPFSFFRRMCVSLDVFLKFCLCWSCRAPFKHWASTTEM